MPLQEVQIPDFLGGIDSANPPFSLRENRGVRVEGLSPIRGRLTSDTGYQQFLGTVRGDPQLVQQFYKKDGSSELILITTQTGYKRLGNQWAYLPTDVQTTLSAAASANDTVLSVNSTAGFSVGDYVGIGLDDGTEHQSTISAIGTGTITIADPMPGPANTGNYVNQALALTGDLDNPVSFVTMPAVDYFIFTNYNDPVKYYDGQKCVTLPGLPTGNDRCRAVALFNNYLFLLSTIEGGQAYPQRVRWSDTGDPTTWTSGNAGFVDLYDSEDFITAAAPLGPYLMIYRERSIIRCEYLGATEQLFSFEQVIAGEGAMSVDSIADMGDMHLFVGNSNVYRYTGGFSIEPVGDPIYYTTFSVDGDMNPAYRHRVFAIYVEELDEVWIFYPAGSKTVPDRCLRYSQSLGSWFLRKFPEEFAGFGFYQKDISTTWANLTGAWDSESRQWGSRAFLSSSPTTLLCSYTNKRVMEYDYIAADDNGTAIAFLFEGKDFQFGEKRGRIDHLEIAHAGPSATVEYSTDRGQTWNTMGTLPASGEITRTRLYKQVLCREFRFRVSGSGSGFILAWAAIRYYEDAPY